ncbi:NosD domain-containing protein [Curtobacterium sp. Leaf261]|uniref:NosD domain-containing protein n=1 Tax=Curtobacterium sp. Leaf261 TaxID=1736311 RepID=UPI0007014A67|nr:NosD domain-containing protein [Curtobacterium sp. Leaf261]KQO60249.1 hypothetical protein ASF23_14890 [Curtobacterium sp. Leaf261]
MPKSFREHRPQLVTGVVGLVVGAVVVGGIWIATAAGHHDGPVTASSAAPSSSGSPSSSSSARPGAAASRSASSAPVAGGAVATTVRCTGATTTVRSAGQLTAALQAAAPGDVIALAAGTYTGNFEGTASGTQSDPITLCGGSSAVLDGGDTDKGYVLHLQGASWWRLAGFTVQNGQKGVMFDDVQHSLIDGLTVTRIGDEAVHLRAGSSDNTVAASTVTDTGLRKPQFGEGIYIGSSKSNWCTVSDCKQDSSDRNVVTGNTISGTAAESVDIKEGTTGGTLSDNSFDGTGMQGENHADSWVDVKGNDWTISGNRGVHSLLDGFQTHELLSGWGTDNTFTGNTVDLGNSDGVAFAFRPVEGNTVSCDNTVIGSNEFSTTKCTR